MESADTLRLIFQRIKRRAQDLYANIRHAIATRAPVATRIAFSHDIRQLKEFALDILFDAQQVVPHANLVSLDRAQAAYLHEYLDVQRQLQVSLQGSELLAVMPDGVPIDFQTVVRLPLAEAQPEPAIEEVRAGPAQAAAILDDADAPGPVLEAAAAVKADPQAEQQPAVREPAGRRERRQQAVAERCWCCGVRPRHSIDDCPDFVRLLVNERADKARQNSQCFRCLNGQHRMRSCPLKMTCDLCRGFHHALLHHARRVTAPADEMSDDGDSDEFHPDVPTGRIRLH